MIASIWRLAVMTLGTYLEATGGWAYTARPLGTLLYNVNYN